MKTRKSSRPRTLPWGHSSLNRERRCKDSMELRLDAIGRVCGGQGGMADYRKLEICLERLLSDLETV